MHDQSSRLAFVSASESSPASEAHFRPSALAAATATFVLTGATASLYGPLLLGFAHHFHLTVPAAGTVISVNFAGALPGVLCGWLGVKRASGGLVLAVSSIVLAAGAIGAALSPRWTLFLLSVFVIGLGFGGLDFSLNTLLARTSLVGRVHRLSVANAGYGVGAVIGPLLVVALHPRHFPTLFVGIGALAVALATLYRGVHAPPLRAEVHQRRVSSMRAQRRPILVTFVVAYVLYVALETSSSGWMATQLHGEGHTESLAGLVTAGFWAGLAVGRVLGAPLFRRSSDKILVLGGLGGVIVLSVSALSTAVAPFTYPVMGLVMASVFPMGLIWYTVLCPHDGDGLALMILFMMAGGVIGPGLESLMVSAFSVHVIPVVIAAFALADLFVFASALRFRPLVATERTP